MLTTAPWAEAGNKRKVYFWISSGPMWDHSALYNRGKLSAYTMLRPQNINSLPISIVFRHLMQFLIQKHIFTQPQLPPKQIVLWFNSILADWKYWVCTTSCKGRYQQTVVLGLMGNGMGVGIEGVTTPHLSCWPPLLRGGLRDRRFLDFCSGNWSIMDQSMYNLEFENIYLQSFISCLSVT